MTSPYPLVILSGVGARATTQSKDLCIFMSLAPAMNPDVETRLAASPKKTRSYKNQAFTPPAARALSIPRPQISPRPYASRAGRGFRQYAPPSRPAKSDLAAPIPRRRQGADAAPSSPDSDARTPAGLNAARL